LSTSFQDLLILSPAPSYNLNGRSAYCWIQKRRPCL